MTIEEKLINYCSQSENFCSSKGSIKKMKGKPKAGEKYENHLCDNAPVSRIQKILLQNPS